MINPPFRLVIFLVAPFNKIPLFSKDLITFIISLFVRVIPESLIDEISFSIFLQIVLSPASTRISSFNFSVPIFFNYFLNKFLIEFANDVISLIGVGKPNIWGGRPNRNPPNYTVLDNWVFEHFILVDEPFAKALQDFETSVAVIDNLCGKLDSKLLQFRFFIPDFNLLSCKLDNFTFKVLYWVILY